MGWLKLGARTGKQTPAVIGFDDELKSTIQHIETVSISPGTPQKYDFVPVSLSDNDLPYIPSDEVTKRKSASNGGLFIVVDCIVFDCTHFISEHPGGEQIIRSFAGAECSWQFWRFHGEKEMKNFGKKLRVGRTEGLENKFKEPPKYVGLRRFGEDWD